MPDFTRFDFNAHDFLNSETVESMTNEEVGQYILLLSKSWLIAKGASLPDDLELLAKYARCQKVSTRVLSRFPVVETEFGTRRRNEVLYNEWVKTVSRYEVASENGKKGGQSTSIYKTDAARENGKLGGRPRTDITQAVTQTQSYQTNHTKPIQTNVHSGGDFKNMAVRYRKSFGVNLSHGNAQKDEYSKACLKFGEDAVLDKFDEWAKDNQWIRERRHTNGLRQFYDALPAIVEADLTIDAQQEEKVAQIASNAENEKSILELNHARFLEEDREFKDQQEDLAAQRARLAADPEAMFGGTG